MRGMDNGPWTGLGTLSWFLGVWVVMMAAMMFPSVAPTVALYARMTRQRSPLSPLLFAAGYLVTWAVAGAARLRDRGGRRPGHGRCARLGSRRSVGRGRDPHRRGRLRVDAAQGRLSRQMPQPARPSCSALGAAAGSGALRMGAKNGAWCLGCCWALMASLFALGVMSILWMAVVAGLIAVEKTLPWRRVATYGTAAILLGLGVLLLVAPDTIPGLTIPHGHSMERMPSIRSGASNLRPCPSAPGMQHLQSRTVCRTVTQHSILPTAQRCAGSWARSACRGQMLHHGALLLEAIRGL